MYHLRLFGSPALEIGDVALTGRAVHRHRLALLALLALAPGRRMTRDKLMAYLWPERDAESGRNLLKQATYVLRSELNEHTLLSEGDELRMNEQVVTSDVAEFDVACSQLDFVRATQLYSGPFMDGFFLSEAPEFTEWMALERQRLANAYASALEALAAGAETSGDWSAASEWWKRRAAHDPADTRVAVRLMHALDASGSRATALQHAALHHQHLQNEFGMDAPAELAAAVDELRSAPSAPIQPHPIHAGRVDLNGDTETSAITPPQARRRWMQALVPVSMIVLLATAFWAAAPRHTDPAPSIVVLPFKNLSQDANQDYFSDGLTEEIIARLSSLEALKVISRTSAMYYKDTRKPLREIARELDVAHVLEGSVRYVNGRVRITAQLIDAKTDDHIWAENYELTVHDSFRVQDQIARAVAEALEVKLRKDGHVVARGTDDPEAHEMYRRGRWLWTQRTRESVGQAIQYFESAIARDSGYSDAYAGLADAYIVSYQLGFGISEDSARLLNRWAAERALALDDASTDAHAAAAVSHIWQSNWPGAEREYKRALELNPGNASARSLYAMLLFASGRLEEAREHARLAYESDPYALIISIGYAYSSFLLRDYDAALEQYRRTMELRPDWPPTRIQMAVVYSLQGRHSEAIQFADQALSLAPGHAGNLADAALVYARAGKRAEAQELMQRAKRSEIAEWAAFHVGRAHVALGEADSALVWLERSEWKWPHRAQLIDPALDPLRTDRRFADLTARVERELGMHLSETGSTRASAGPLLSRSAH